MGKKREKVGSKRTDSKKSRTRNEVISYRLKCARTANGLSHFVMYGDVPREKSLL